MTESENIPETPSMKHMRAARAVVDYVEELQKTKGVIWAEGIARVLEREYAITYGPVEEAVRQMRETLEGVRDDENRDVKDREVARKTLEGMDAIAAGKVPLPLPHLGSAED